MKTFLSELLPAARATGVLCVITCGVYPLVVTGVAETFFRSKAHGSLILDATGEVRGSALIGQTFSSLDHFHSRPSAAGAGYDAASSGGSNLGPTSQKLHDLLLRRIADYRTINGLAPDVPIPADAVTASASGLDPHISVQNARLQAPRIAKARGLGLASLEKVIAAQTVGLDLGLLGELRVHVLKLNQALDALTSSDHD